MSSSAEDSPPQLVSSRNERKRKRPISNVVKSNKENITEKVVKNDHFTFDDKLDESADNIEDVKNDENQVHDDSEEAVSQDDMSDENHDETTSNSDQGSEELIEDQDEQMPEQDMEENRTTDDHDSRFVFNDEDLDQDESPEHEATTPLRKPVQPSSTKPKPGIIYISRIPPGMSPSKLKSLLLKALPTHNAKGEPTQIGRLFLQPENALVAKARAAKQSKKKTRRIFTEGWVELPYRKLAKRAAETLNGMPMIPPSNAGTMSKRKATNRDPYASDLWALKYLPSFKWDDLTSQLATERAARRERELQEIRRSKKEAEGYMDAVAKAKMIDKIQAKKRAAREDKDQDALGDDRFREIKRQFAQRKPIETYSKDL